MRCLSAFLLLIAMGTTPVRAAGIREFGDGWLLTAGEMRQWLDRSDPAPEPGWWAAVGDARLYGLPELPLRRWAVGGPLPATRGKLAWTVDHQMLGGGLIDERASELRLIFTGVLRVGLAAQRVEMAIDGRPEAAYRGAALLLGRDGSSGVGNWRFDLRAPLDSGAAWSGPNDRRPFARGALLGREAHVAVALEVSRRGDGSFAAGAEASLALGPRLAVGVRADPPTGAVGPVSVWRTGLLLIRTSHLAHPELGTTHRCELVFGRPGGNSP